METKRPSESGIFRQMVAFCRDPRHYQILILSLLHLYSLLQLDFGIVIGRVPILLGIALATQAFWTEQKRLPRFDPRSPLISALSLSLLLRTESVFLAALAAVVTMSSKFLLRWRGKHIFNPTNFGIVVMVLLTGQAWVSPGNWGSGAWFGFLLACLGGVVVNRAARSDVTFAFLGFHASLLLLRAWWLGDPIGIPLHQLQSGALLIFAFLMISDPKTTPDSRAGRVLFALLVALGGYGVQFGLYRPNGLFYSLTFFCCLVPAIDRLLPGTRYQWSRPALSIAFLNPFGFKKQEVLMKRAVLSLIFMSILLLAPGSAFAFCGFYVSRAETRLFNKASRVVLVRDGDRTVVTMASDFRGDPEEFAIVIPVPTFIEREQIHVTDNALLDHLDAYSAPRLVEYFDGNPCVVYARKSRAISTLDMAEEKAGREFDRSLGVTVEAEYTVGEYDIVILSAKESRGLETWLKESGYRIPPGASRVLGSYLKQGLHFFIAKVNLKEQAKLGYSYLRPIQVAFETPKFMLPIRLGTVNADGPQDLVVFALTRKGRVETTNYRTVKLPSGMDLPVYVKDEFADFYRDMFKTAVRKENRRAVFLEYAWDMGWCDPCAADPLSADELRELGVFWLGDGRAIRRVSGQNVFITRLHLRYTGDTFPEDLFFQETSDRANFQGRYVIRHAWKGEDRCPAAQGYREDLQRRREREATTLASLTGRDINEIRRKMGLGELLAGAKGDDRPWWQRLWGD